MQGVWSNLPEVWTTMNRAFDISDMGNVRNKKTGQVLHRYKGANGYACVSLFGNSRQVHTFVLKCFIPKPSPMYTVVDHIDRDRMNPELVNLRWSNTVMNNMNRSGVKGYRTYKYETEVGPVIKYAPTLTILGMPCNLKVFEDPVLARAVYEYWQRRAYEVIDGLCSKSIHWKIQRKIITYWMPLQVSTWNSMKWERDEAYSRLPICGRLS